MKKGGNSFVLLLLFLFPFLSVSADEGQEAGKAEAESSRFVRKLRINDDPSLSVSHVSFLNRQEEGEGLPFRGFLPVGLNVKNEGAADRNLRLRVKESCDSRESSFFASMMNQPISSGAGVSYIYEREMKIPAGEEKSFLFYVPLNELRPDFMQKRRLAYFISDDETGKILARHSLDGGKYGAQAYCAGCMGALYRPELVDENKFGWFRLVLCDPGLLPADSRFYSSMDAFLMSMDDWERMGASHCRALLEWVSAGGLLFVYGFQEGKGLEKGNYGMGRIFKSSTDEGSLGRKLMYAGMINDVQKYRREEACSRELKCEDKDSVLKMGDGVAVYVLLFLLVAGPVNFIFFAPPGKRQRLLWSFPLSVMAAIAGFAVYLKFSNGIIGEGRRFVLVQLCPDFSSAHVFQAQISRNGILWDGSFSLDEAVLIQSFSKAAGPDVEKKLNRQTGVFAYGGQPPKWERIDGVSREGNGIRGAFVSHKVLFHLAEKSVSWKEQIFLEKVRDREEPVVVSDFPVALTRFEYRDEEGRKWGADSVPPGIRVPLQLITEKNKGNSVEEEGNRRDNKWLWRVDPGCFHAEAVACPGVPIDTLPSIRWKDRIMFRGKVHER